jgi:PAS domain S-box-containing protein
MASPPFAELLRSLDLEPNRPPDAAGWARFCEEVGQAWDIMRLREVVGGGSPSETAVFSSQSAPQLRLALDAKGRVTRWNAALGALLGRDADTVLGKTLAECALTWDGRRVEQAVNSVLATGLACELEVVTFRDAAGQEGWMRLTVGPNSLGGDPTLAVVVTGDDITERRRREQIANHAQKLEAVGQLAAGIAHEINTPVQFIGDNLHFLGDAFNDLSKVLAEQARLRDACRASGTCTAELDSVERAESAADVEFLMEEIPKAIHQSSEGVQRVAAIVKAMKDFSHPDSADRQPVDLNQTIATTLTVARNEYKYVADVVTEFDPTLGQVPCFAGEINQVILNLLVNAAHAIGDVVKGKSGKGIITISTRKIGQWAEIRLRDTGTGIPERVRNRLFEPFFTTKPVGKGTGQGLYLSRQIVVKRHNGTIDIETEMGKGTTFIIRLPYEVADG